MFRPEVQAGNAVIGESVAKGVRQFTERVNLKILSGKAVKQVNKLADWFTIQKQGEQVTLPGQESVKGHYISQELDELDGPTLQLHEYFDLEIDSTKISFSRISEPGLAKKGKFRLHSISDQSNEQIPLSERVHTLGNAINTLQEANAKVESEYAEAVRILSVELKAIASRHFANLVGRSSYEKLSDRLTVIAIDSSDLLAEGHDISNNYYQRYFSKSFMLEYLRGEEMKAVQIFFYRVDDHLEYSGMNYDPGDSRIANKVVQTQILTEASEHLEVSWMNRRGSI